MAVDRESPELRRFHYSMPMETVLWEYYGVEKYHGMAGAFGNVKYFKETSRNILRKIRKRINEIVTNDELLLELLLHDVDSLDAEIKALSESMPNEIDVIAKLFLMIGHLLGWAYFEGKFYRTPVYYQTEKERETSLLKGERLKTPFEIPYRKRRLILQMRREGVSYKEIALILRVTVGAVKSLEKAGHLDEWRENYLKRGSF